MFNERDILAESGSQALGFASLGIGLTELAAPAFVESLLGLDDKPSQRGVLRVLGVRELMHGVGILASTDGDKSVTSGVWARVAGDVLDTALLGVAAFRTKRPASFAAVAAAVAAIGVADWYFASKMSGHQRGTYFNPMEWTKCY